YVIDIVPRGMRQRTVLPPAGHAAIDQPRVALHTNLGSQAEPLHDPGPERIDDRIGLPGEPQYGLDALGVLQVDTDRGAAPAADIGLGAEIFEAQSGPGRAIDADHLAAQIRQKRAAQR